MSAPPGGERAGQDTERLVEIDVADGSSSMLVIALAPSNTRSERVVLELVEQLLTPGNSLRLASSVLR